MDTSTYTHFCQAGHSSILAALAPGGVVLVPDVVSEEIDARRGLHADIPSVASATWAELTLLDDEEAWMQLAVKAGLGGEPREHLGECAVIACAYHRGMTAVLDERAAVAQADIRGVSTRDSLSIVVEAYKELFDRGREHTERVVDDLLASGLWLPFESGKSLFAWAYEEGLLP